ncbi:E3 ubiquitin protein ligase UPL1-like protein, partial [Tanacetum coccineum]
MLEKAILASELKELQLRLFTMSDEIAWNSLCGSFSTLFNTLLKSLKKLKLEAEESSKVHGQLGIAKGLIGMAAEPIERNGTSIETSRTEGNGFHHPLLSRPLQSGDLGSTRLSRGTLYHNLESLSGWNVVVAPSNMFDALVLSHNHVHSGVLPTPLGDNFVAMESVYSSSLLWLTIYKISTAFLATRVYTLTGELLKKLASIVPSHRKFFIVELSDLARSLSSKAVPELITLRNTQMLVDGNKSKGVESDGNQEHVTMWKLHVSLEPLWQELSECIGVTESQLGQGSLSSVVVKANLGDPPLPLGTQRLLPFIEAFMVLCDKLQENRSLLQQDNACATESKIKQSITSSSQSQTTQGIVTFPKFTEKHSRLLNAFVRQDPGLLEKSLSILLKARPLRVTVHQAYVIEDSYNQLRMVILDKGSLLFTTGGNNATFQPNPNSVYQTEHLSYFKFVGRVVAKALFDGQLLDVYFTRSFYKHILGFKNDVSDIPDLTFSMDADEEKHILYEKTKVSDYELKPGGGNIRVTEETKHEYVDLVADYKLTSAIRSQINSFLESFSELIPRELISIFNDKELELLNNGLPEINLNDLQANTKYSGYTAASNAVTWFWEVLKAFKKEDRASEQIRS